MNRLTRTLLRWLPAVAWAAVIFVLSAQPGSRVPGRWSTELHMAVYAVLGALVWLALGGRNAGWKGFVTAVLIASLYGASDEFHQSFVPTRTPDVADWAADTLGAAIGVSVAWIVARAVARRGERSGGSEAEREG
jgi:VanZ family protein